MRAAVELEGKFLDVTLSVQQASNGKFFFNLMEWGEFGQAGKETRLKFPACLPNTGTVAGDRATRVFIQAPEVLLSGSLTTSPAHRRSHPEKI